MQNSNLYQNNQLVEIVNLFHEYQSKKNDTESSIADFCKDYLEKINPKIAQNTLQKMSQDFLQNNIDNQNVHLHKKIIVEGQLGRFLGMMARFSDIELKNVAQIIEVDNIEEIWYLGAMFDLKTPTKSDIIHHCISEYSSGIAVINRLIAKNYIEEYPDTQDKRAKRLKITQKGTEKLLSAFPNLETMAKDIFLPLSDVEKENLLNILSKLEHFHREKYNRKKA